jgi:hypothetical protein
MSLRQLLHKPVWAWRVIGVIALVVATWSVVLGHRVIVNGGVITGASMRDEARRLDAASTCKDLIDTTKPTTLDGIGMEFLADLASIREGRPWVTGEPPRPGDRRGCVRIVITNELGQALHLLLQDEYASGGFHFQLVSYTKITHIAAPNGGPTTPVGDSGASGGRHR